MKYDRSGGREAGFFYYIIVVRGADSREPVRRNIIKMSCIYHTNRDINN